VFQCVFRCGSVDRTYEHLTSDEPFVGVTVPFKSPLIDRVATFLGNVPEKSTQTAINNEMVRPSISENEFISWRESIHGCSHIAQLHLIVRKISKSRPGSQFRGMKRCLADLKALKAVRNIRKNCSGRRRDNMELLQRGVVIVEKFLDANRSDCVKVGR